MYASLGMALLEEKTFHIGDEVISLRMSIGVSVGGFDFKRPLISLYVLQNQKNTYYHMKKRKYRKISPQYRHGGDDPKSFSFRAHYLSLPTYCRF